MSTLENSTDHSHNLTSSEGGKDASEYKISGHSLHAFSRKCLETQIWPISLSQNSANITILSNQFRRWSRYISMKNFLASMCRPANAWKPFRTDWRTCRKMAIVGQMDERTHVQVERGYYRLLTDRQTDWGTDRWQDRRRMDGQPENIMPLASKEGGMREAWLIKSSIMHIFSEAEPS